MNKFLFTILFSFCFANAFNCDKAIIKEYDNGYGDKNFKLKCYDEIHDSVLYSFWLQNDGTWNSYFETTYNNDGTHTRNDVYWHPGQQAIFVNKSVVDEFGVILKDICYKVKWSYQQKFIMNKWLKMKKYIKE